MNSQDELGNPVALKDYRFGESVGYLIKRVRAALSMAVDRELVEFGISHEQLSILMMIAEKKESTAAELSRGIACDTSSMTRMIDRLEAKALVKRARSSDDRRIVWIGITEAGQALSDRLPELLVRVTNRQLAGFSPDEVDLLKGLLRRMLDNTCEPSFGRSAASTPPSSATK